MAEPLAEVIDFRFSQELLNALEQKIVSPHVIFMDIEMPGITGVALANKINDIDPNINIVFVTGHQQYTYDALQLRASGYVLKPVTPEKIKTQLQNLRNPLKIISLHKIYVQCFGTFQVFVEGKILK